MSTAVMNSSQSQKTSQPHGVNAVLRTPLKLRDPIVNTVLTALTLVIAVITTGNSRVSFSGITSWFTINDLNIPSKLFSAIMLIVGLIGTSYAWKAALDRRKVPVWNTAIVASAFLCSFVLSTVAGNDNAFLPVVALFTGMVPFAVPLIFGSLSGVVCERTGVINIAIEGQLLFGAFIAAIFATLFSNPYVGLLAAPIGGVLIAVLLALFAVNFRTDQIVVGVVLNMLALGLTSFLYSTVLTKSASTLNSPAQLPKLKLPVIGDIPLLGPVLFNQSALVYCMYIIVILINFFLFKSRWGLRSRACGEHPKAADTVGIKVNSLRWKNVLIGGALAGFGGAFFTVGSGLAFTENCSAGNGFIALAAMILGGWRPLGAVTASILFGFATNIALIMQSVGGSIPSEFLLMIPYLVTVLAVAGFVGAVRAPAAENQPYPA